jgi:hypothetical protein
MVRLMRSMQCRGQVAISVAGQVAGVVGGMRNKGRGSMIMHQEKSFMHLVLREKGGGEISLRMVRAATDDFFVL